MADKTIHISIPTDEDGFVSFECPHCEQRFKLRANEFEESDIINLFCPICGLAHELNHFYSKDFIEMTMNLAKQEAMEMIHDMFKGLERKSRGNKFVKFKAGSKTKVDIKEIYENLDELIEFEMECCNKHIKVTELDKLIGVYCSYCGVKNGNE